MNKAESIYIDTSISYFKINIMSIIVAFLIFTVLTLSYIIRWGYHSLSIVFSIEGGFNTIIFILSLIIGVVTHEFIHGIAYYVFGKVKKTDVEFGIDWKSFVPYARCKVPVSSLVYVKVGLAPVFMLGIIPVVLCIVFENLSFIFLWAIIMFMVCSGDLCILWSIRKYLKKFLVFDHPKRAGCYVKKA